jgi:hypothetical protein
VWHSDTAGSSMPASRTFPGVTAEALDRIKALGRTEHNVVFDPPDGPRSSATSQTPLGECVIEFVHDGTRAELTLTIVRKPWLVPENLLWNAFLETLERCREPT